jgi:hypothetical protein
MNLTDIRTFVAGNPQPGTGALMVSKLPRFGEVLAA